MPRSHHLPPTISSPRPPAPSRPLPPSLTILSWNKFPLPNVL
ncbi:MAG TPA: hypothetical protein VLL52_06975 [Anaerolineae bacterium]|nr:hypothetical protein [Anaerolineae bacterium]